MISKIKYLKSEFGYTGQDLLIAMFILVVFLGLMTGVYVNLSNTSYEIKLTSEATEISTDFLEYIDELYYDEIEIITQENPDSDADIDGIVKKSNLVSANQISNVNKKIKEHIIDDMDIDNKFDLSYSVSVDNKGIKTITVWVKFDWKGDNHVIENSIIKEKEYIKPQNSPDLSDVDYQPIKCVFDENNSDWKFVKVTDTDDVEWYNYENHRWALAVDNSATFDTNGELLTCSNVYAWIPRYYVTIDNNNNPSIHFLFKSPEDDIDNSKYLDKVINQNSDDSYYLENIEIDYSQDYTQTGYNTIYYYTNNNIDDYNTGIWVKVESDSNKSIKLDNNHYDINDEDRNLYDLFNRLNYYSSDSSYYSSVTTYNASNTRIPIM